MLNPAPRRCRVLLIAAVCLFATTSAGASPEGPVPVPDSPGVFRKVIVNRDGVVLRTSPDENSNGAEAKAFSIFFQLYTPDGQESQNGWIRVGNQQGEAYGWLRPEQDVYEWNTRFTLKPSSNQSGPRFSVRATKPKPFTAHFNGSSGGRDKAVIVPILDSAVTQNGRDEYPVALYAASVSSAAGGGIGAREAIQPRETKVEIVFVIDTTASMGHPIEGSMEVARQVATQLARHPELKGSFQFGLVQYRDSEPGITFRTRGGSSDVKLVVAPVSPIDQFLTGLSSISAADAGSGEVEEDVLAGLLEAIENGGWSSNSSKHIILLGDASAHLPGSPKSTTGLDIGRLIAMAQGNNGSETSKRLTTYYLHAVRAIQTEAPPSELALCQQQFRELSRNGGDFDGFYEELDPNDRRDRERVIQELVTFFGTGIEALTAQQAGDVMKLKELAAEASGTNQLAQGLWLIEQAVNGDPIQPVSLGTTFDRSEDGELLAQKQVLISEDSLRRVRSVLDLLLISLSKRVDPTQRGDAGSLLKAIQQTLAGAVTGQELDQDTSLDQLINGLPLRTDVLRTSVRSLAAKDADSFRKWLSALEAARDRSEELLETSEQDFWHELSEQAANEKYAYIGLNELP